MPTAVLAVAAVALLAATGLSVAAMLLRSAAEVVLAAFVLAFAEVVGARARPLTFGAVRRPALVAGMVALCAAAVWRMVELRAAVPR